MWIVAHLQKCQAIKLPQLNEVILIRMDRKKIHRLLFISIIRKEPLVFSFLKCDICTHRIDFNTWNEF